MLTTSQASSSASASCTMRRREGCPPFAAVAGAAETALPNQGAQAGLGQNVYDVYTKSTATGLDGTKYKDW